MVAKTPHRPCLFDVVSGRPTIRRPVERHSVHRIEIACIDPVELFEVSVANSNTILARWENPKTMAVTALEDGSQVSTHIC